MEMPEVIPPVELHGSPGHRLRTLDAAIARLQALRRAIAGEPTPIPPPELHGPYINAPVWPWFAAGCVLGALFVLLFVVAWSYS